MMDATVVRDAIATEASRSVVIPATAALLSYPMRWVGQLLLWLPGPRDKIPVVLMMIGWMAGYAIGFFTTVPQAEAATIGSMAGLGSGVAYAGEKAVKQAYRGAVSRVMGTRPTNGGGE
jgi:hypothetical protein